MGVSRSWDTPEQMWTFTNQSHEPAEMVMQVKNLKTGTCLGALQDNKTVALLPCELNPYLDWVPFR